MPTEARQAKLARVFLTLAWLLPIAHILLQGFVPDMAPWLPSGVGIEDSDKILVCSLTGLAVLALLSTKVPVGTSLGKVTLGFLGWAVVSSLLSSAPFDSLLFATVWFSAACFFLGARTWTQLDSLDGRLGILHLPILLICVHSILPVLAETDFQRVAGIFLLPGVLANWLVLVLPLCLVDAWKGKGYPAMVAGLAAASALTCIALSFSRAGWLCAAIELSLILLIFQELPLKKIAAWACYVCLLMVSAYAIRSQLNLTIWAIGVLLLLLVPVLVTSKKTTLPRPRVLKFVFILALASLFVLGLTRLHASRQLGGFATKRMESLRQSDNSANARVELWRSAISMALDNPIKGVGPGEFRVHYPRFQTKFYYYSDSAHSAGLEMLADLGFVGFALFLALVVVLISGSVKKDLSIHQKTALLAFLCGAAYAQVEVTYQFAYLWLTLALVARLIVGLPDSKQGEPEARIPNWPIFLAVPLLAVSLYLLVSLKAHEMGRRHREPDVSASLLQGSSDKLPMWRKGAIAAFNATFVNDPKAIQLPRPQLRMLNLGRESAAANGLAGEYLLSAGRMAEARSYLEIAEKLDPYNHPAIYQHLFNVGLKTSDEKLADRVVAKVLGIYDLTQIKSAHFAHRAKLLGHLVPMLYRFCAYLNPYNKPKQTEVLYRFLYDNKVTAQAAHGLGVSLWTQGKYEEAKPYLLEANQIDPVYPVPK